MVSQQQSQDVTLGDAVGRFLSGIATDHRIVAQQELNGFVRWLGGARLLRDLTPHDVERYADRISASVEPATRLAPIKTFLTFARKEGMVEENLAVHIKLRKTGNRGKEKTTRIPTEMVRLTAEGHAQLTEELDGLHAQRPEIADELRHAMADKDFRENAPLDAARHRQGLIEARIRELEAILKRAEVVKDAQVSTTRAGIGCSVVLFDLTQEQQVRYTLVHSNEANIAQGKVSVASPLGKALVDRTAGDVVEVKAPAGTMHYRLDAIVGLS